MGMLQQWRRLWNTGWAPPGDLISEAKAIELVRQYASAHGHLFGTSRGVHLEQRPLDRSNPRAGKRTFYVLALGTTKPIPFVEVDAIDNDNTVVAWRQGSR